MTSYDVIVVGSGGAGLTAAISAAAGGARVAVLEVAKLFGGTTSVAGGGLWIPDNRYMAEQGVGDTREEAVAYIKRLVNHRDLDQLIDRYLDECNPTLEFLEAHTKVRFEVAPHPDYHPDFYGARDYGRCIHQGLYDTNGLGALKDSLRIGHGWWGYTRNELYRAEHGDPIRFELSRLNQERRQKGLIGGGAGLVGGLLEGCQHHAVELHSGTRAVELTRQDGRVTGIVVEKDGVRDRLIAKLGVVLACGGFEWNRSFVDRFLGVPMVAPGSPGDNVGDGLLMAARVGGGLATMTEAWWAPMYSVEGDRYEGHQLSRPTTDLRGKPGMIIVNRFGRRFANEALNYHDFGKAMFAFEPGAYEYPNAPAYLLFDQECRSTYPFHTVEPGDPDPVWLHKGTTLTEVAESANIAADSLTTEVARFNADARIGIDSAFRRGATAYDRHVGDVTKPGSAANLRPLGDGPYYALRIELGCLGTKGGPTTDVNAQVLDLDGKPIIGLYAAGNTAAHVFGSAYPGAGATLGPALTFGYIAGRSITEQTRSR
jgi:3-oxosteroid 1-dehydrogenase